MRLAQRLHLLPDSETALQDREQDDKRREEARDGRRKKLAEGAALAERVRKGEDGAPLTSEAFMTVMGFPPEDGK